MAKKKNNENKLDYMAEVKKLKSEGPKRLYLLHGEEDYLREQFLVTLKAVCLPEGEDDFSYKRLDGPEIEYSAFAEAVDSLPFMTERTFVEVRDADINKLRDAERFLKLLEDIPDYCTVAFILDAGYELDKRLKFTKSFLALAYDMSFSTQSQSQLFNWISRRFAAAGKRIDFEAVQRLIFVSGSLMNQLIPEIEKVAAYTEGECVTCAEVDAVAHHIPEADVFAMTGHIAKREYNVAAGILAELISGGEDNEPIMVLALIGIQMRKLYAAKLALEEGLDIKYVMSTCRMGYESYARQLVEQARGFSFPQLKRALELCAEADYKMKSSSDDAVELLKETFMRIAAGENDGADK